MSNQQIFCNTPWYELHIYWDGSLGLCCQETNKLYHTNQTQYNIATMSIMDWFNSQPTKDFRKTILGDQRTDICRLCYVDEDNGNNSRRLKSNQKSVIFTRTAFDASWQQSPGHKHFQHSIDNQGATISYPVDIHIDPGNYCNLACKMCSSKASSTIAGQEVKWGITDSKQYLGTDWTRNATVWENFKRQLLDIPNLVNIHVMGGETLLTDKFEDLVDFMILHNRLDLNFSFVTNGTKFDPELIAKLKKFNRVGIEISIESIHQRNDYIRQGSNIQSVLHNISQYREMCDNSSTSVTLRTAVSMLSVGDYMDLLDYAWREKLVVKSNIVLTPRFLDVQVLPDKIKKLYLLKVEQFLSKFDHVAATGDYNASDVHNIDMIIKEQAIQCRTALQSPAPVDADNLLQQLVQHCQRWDAVYKLNASELYPELKDIFDQYGYQHAPT